MGRKRVVGNGEILKDLRSKGYKVRVNHYRVYNDWTSARQLLNSFKAITGIEELKPEPVLRQKHEGPGARFAIQRGGRTIVEASHPDGDHWIVASNCSDKDNFNRKLGLKIALGKLLKILPSAEGEYNTCHATGGEGD